MIVKKIFSDSPRKIFIKGLSEYTAPFNFLNGDFYKNGECVDKFFKSQTSKKLDLTKILGKDSKTTPAEKRWYKVANTIYEMLFHKQLRTEGDLEKLCSVRIAEFSPKKEKVIIVKEVDGQYNGRDVVYGVPFDRKAPGDFFYIKPYTIHSSNSVEAEIFAAERAGLKPVLNKKGDKVAEPRRYYCQDTSIDGKVTEKDYFEWIPWHNVFSRVSHE